MQPADILSQIPVDHSPEQRQDLIDRLVTEREAEIRLLRAEKEQQAQQQRLTSILTALGQSTDFVEGYVNGYLADLEADLLTQVQHATDADLPKARQLWTYIKAMRQDILTQITVS